MTQMRTRLGATFVLALRAIQIHDRGSSQSAACGMQVIEWLGFRQGIGFWAVGAAGLVMPLRAPERRYERRIPAERLRQTHVVVGDLPNLLGSQAPRVRRLELTSFLHNKPLRCSARDDHRATRLPRSHTRLFWLYDFSPGLAGSSVCKRNRFVTKRPSSSANSRPSLSTVCRSCGICS
jgi:hypothetical protein